jgi:tetratricopeptide (TPR) repeat protein
MRALRAVGVLGLICAVAETASASKYVIVVHTVAGWQLQGAEKIAINGKVKIRRARDAKPEITADTYDKLSPEVLGAVALRLHRGGYLVERSGQAWNPVFPDGARIKGSATAQSLWAAATVVYQADKNSKDMAFRSADVFAILPGTAVPAEAAVAMVADEGNFRGLGEASPAEAFDDRMAMLVGISTIAEGGALDKLKNMLGTAMNTANQRSSTGTGRLVELTQGLRFAEVSEKAFPSDPQQMAMRKALLDKKAWLDQRIAILKAFAAASEWDPLIDKYADFEEYDEGFDDLRKIHERSFKESEVLHTSEGKRLFDEKQCTPALDQLSIARKRNPGSRELETLFSAFRTECYAGGTKPKRPEPTRSQMIQIQSSLTLAEKYMTDGKFEEAEADIATADGVLRSYPSVVLTRAKLLRARRDYDKAIETLDTFDQLTLTDEEATKGAALRSEIAYERDTGRSTARAETAKAEADGDYVAAFKLVRAGIQLDPNDPELLYHAGLDAAITRDVKDAPQFWRNYLAASQSWTSESKRRTEVITLLPEISTAPKPPAGTPNWFSNYNVRPGVMYDPVSLAPNAHPAEVRASKKQTTVFEWSNGVLLAVKTTSMIPGEKPYAVYFDYFPGRKGVRRISTEAFDDKADPGLPKLTVDGAVGPGKGAWVELFSDPAVNPYMVERLTGKRVATIVAGNPWFQPFVWTDTYSFLAEYDAEGHVKSAKPLHAKDGGKPLDFVWDGDKLLSITERGGEYRRDMKYDGARLMSETVVYRGRTSKINYKYNGERLVEADCDTDLSIDARSRHVTFGN